MCVLYVCDLVYIQSDVKYDVDLFVHYATDPLIDSKRKMISGDFREYRMQIACKVFTLL